MRYLIGILAVVCISCGGNAPTAPTPPPAPPPSPINISGNWQGTWTYTPNGGGQRTVTAMTLQLTQSTASVNGTFQIQGATGTLTGSTDPSSFSGTFTIQGRTIAGLPCNGQGIVSGPASLQQLRWSNQVINSNDCTWFSANEWLLTR